MFFKNIPMKHSILFLLFSFFQFSLFSQQEPLKKEQLIQPSELAKKLSDAAVKPVVLNVGTVDQIKTAIKAGPCNSEDGLKAFKRVVSGIDKTKEVVVYCGCCSSSNCPNIRPAIKYLSENGYKKAKVLDIPTGIKEDWVQKGYPVE
jgi:rhodanese-related sulfurtransferase